MKLLSIFFLCLALTACQKSSNDNNPPTSSDNNSSSDNDGNGTPTTTTTTTTTMMPPTTTRVPQGKWGGMGISLNVKNKSTFELDCAHGTIHQVLIMDHDGDFHARGEITLEHGGPVTPGEELPTFDAKFSGEVNRTNMSLDIDYVNDAHETIHQNFMLKQGENGILHKCL